MAATAISFSEMTTCQLLHRRSQAGVVTVVITPVRLSEHWQVKGCRQQAML